MTVDTFVHCAPHEGDLHLIFSAYGLGPYFAMDRVRKDHDGWKTTGKPTRTIHFDGDEWALAYDYDTDNPLDPREHQDYHLQSVPEFRFYFVAKDELYDGEKADQSKRIRGGTMTVRPRWPGLTANGKKVKGIPNIGKPYIDVQIQASNIDHTLYHKLAIQVISAFDVNPKYLQEVHEMSNWQDIAVYTRLKRSESGPVYAADGPIARSHQLLEGDREGYRKHVEDHRKIPGYYVTTSVNDQRSHDLIKGHTLGKEIKHYYPIEPRDDPDDPLYHPKLEVAYQTSLTDETVYWEDTQDAVRELEETLLNTLDWAGLPVHGNDGDDHSGNGGVFVKDAYFTARDGHQRSRKLVACPLPEIKDAQEAAVMSLWGSALQSDRELIDLLLSDGGEISPTNASEKTGYSYRTIREIIDRCGSVLKHTYGKIEIASKHQRDLLLERVRATGAEFTNTVEHAVLTAAEAASDRRRSKWSETRREYNITVDSDPDDCRKLLKVSYQPEDEYEAREVIRSIKTAYLSTHNDRGGAHGVHAVLTLKDGTRKRYKSLEAKTIAPRSGSSRAKRYREAIESVTDREWELWSQGRSVT
ncbi:winged helix-turn-helix domain-containing protein [Natronocalculus amylovorans]|uniref:Winged helix-turn-helix domain-containing protein n=1 Tax=Natronocalculus amylovorans TaxID=2917812 RepID=A0AAE3FX63_9EURY|nr:winged helix-turn-helix domain-containing protein [Natronocalculus amylovorans]MCL9817013.1 winged helix-turn-helix domain-containing protein [Natronocalculus amylovorans]